MTLIACVDNSLGIMFGGRRISRDAIIYKRITELVGDGKLYLSTYSYPLFCGYDVEINDNCLELANENDFCFLEDGDVKPYIGKIDRIILYFWNREYPSDKKFEISLNDFTVESEFEFAGNSHDVITERVYVRI